MADDKPVALLTTKQREYLEGEPVSQSYERNLRSDIQDRIEATMGDFVRLFAELDQEDVREAFGDGTAHTVRKDDEKFKRALEEVSEPKEIDKEDVDEDVPTPRGTGGNAPAAIAFLLRGLNYRKHPIYEHFEETDQNQPAFEHFIETVEQGISLYLQQETNYTARVSVEIDLEDLTPIDELVEETNPE